MDPRRVGYFIERNERFFERRGGYDYDTNIASDDSETTQVEAGCELGNDDETDYHDCESHIEQVEGNRAEFG